MISPETWAEMAWEHYEEYEHRAQCLGISRLTPFVPADKMGLSCANATDPHLNNIQLDRWSQKHCYVYTLYKTARLRLKKPASWSIADSVCVLKHVAKYHILCLPPPPKVPAD